MRSRYVALDEAHHLSGLGFEVFSAFASPPQAGMGLGVQPEDDKPAVKVDEPPSLEEVMARWRGREEQIRMLSDALDPQVSNSFDQVPAGVEQSLCPLGGVCLSWTT
jgi:hypothetical protein